LLRRRLAGLAILAAALVCTSASAAPADPIGDLLHNVQSAADAALKAPELLMKATYYFIGAKGVRSRDSMGCRAVPMRTLAVDPAVVPKGSIVFIKETVGLPLPGGGIHDGLWYASDVGGLIKGDRIDLYTGTGPASARAVKALNLQALSVTRISTFEGCPPTS
jgi:3D (Asp-Asp-Asp) domain-containing protein